MRGTFASAAILLGYCTLVSADAPIFEQRSPVIPFTSSALRLTDLLFAPKEYIHQHNQGREA
jgi:hypothetical protein